MSVPKKSALLYAHPRGLPSLLSPDGLITVLRKSLKCNCPDERGSKSEHMRCGWRRSLTDLESHSPPLYHGLPPPRCESRSELHYRDKSKPSYISRKLETQKPLPPFLPAAIPVTFAQQQEGGEEPKHGHK